MDRIETDEHRPSETEFDGGAPELPRATLAEPSLPLQSLTGAATQPSAPAPAAVASSLSSSSSQTGPQKRPLDHSSDQDGRPKRKLDRFIVYAKAAERLAAGSGMPSECPICNLDTRECPPIVYLKSCARPHWICLGCLYGILVGHRASKKCPQCMQPISYMDVPQVDQSFTGIRVGLWFASAVDLHLAHKSCSFVNRGVLSYMVAGAVCTSGIQCTDLQSAARLRKYLSIEAVTAVELAESLPPPLPTDMQGHTLRIAPLTPQFLPYNADRFSLHRNISKYVVATPGRPECISFELNWLGIAVGVNPAAFENCNTGFFGTIISVANDFVGRYSMNANLCCKTLSVADTTGVSEDGSIINILQFLVAEMLQQGVTPYGISMIAGARSTALVLQTLELDSPANYAAEYRRLLLQAGTSPDAGAYFYPLCKKYELVDASHADAVLNYLKTCPKRAATSEMVHTNLGGTSAWVNSIIFELANTQRFGRRVRSAVTRDGTKVSLELCDDSSRGLDPG